MAKPCSICGEPKNKGIHGYGCTKYCDACRKIEEVKRGKYSRPYKHLAHSYVRHAVLNGHIPKLDGSLLCIDCGLPACCYDHRDYFKPMDVEPVCKSCNRLRGSALNDISVARIPKETP